MGETTTYEALRRALVAIEVCLLEHPTCAEKHDALRGIHDDMVAAMRRESEAEEARLQMVIGTDGGA